MQEQIFKIKSSKFNFKIKKMNAIDLLALQTQVNFENLKVTKEFFNIVLENMEVEIDNLWYPVKEGNIYYPNGIEDDVNAIQELLSYFTEKYMLPIFQKSSESKK